MTNSSPSLPLPALAAERDAIANEDPALNKAGVR